MHTLTPAVARYCRAEFIKVLESSLPPYELGQLGLWSDDDEKFIESEVRRLMYEPVLPNAGDDERDIIEQWLRGRRGGDLSGGQQLGAQANAIVRSHELPALNFWAFDQDRSTLKHQLHDGFEEMDLSAEEEEELLDEAVLAFHTTQRLLAELAQLE